MVPPCFHNYYYLIVFDRIVSEKTEPNIFVIPLQTYDKTPYLHRGHSPNSFPTFERRQLNNNNNNNNNNNKSHIDFNVLRRHTQIV